jgi:phosphoglycolate phosphatase-like HAD superfamily hydrolase
MLKAMIFDVDGTLVDSVDIHALSWQQAFRQFGHEVSFEDIRSQIGRGGDQLLPVFLSEIDIETQGPQIEAVRGELVKNRFLPQIAGFPRVRELMQVLIDRHVDIVLASSAKRDELSAYKRICGIDDIVTKETTSDDADRSKPHPDIFEAALRLVPEIQKNEIMVVGDSPFDAIAAAKAGLRTVGVLCGGFAEEDLWRAGCLALFRDPADLLDRLDELPLNQI